MGKTVAVQGRGLEIGSLEHEYIGWLSLISRDFSGLEVDTRNQPLISCDKNTNNLLPLQKFYL